MTWNTRKLTTEGKLTSLYMRILCKSLNKSACDLSVLAKINIKYRKRANENILKHT